jgi:hypothetical protein
MSQFSAKGDIISSVGRTFNLDSLLTALPLQGRHFPSTWVELSWMYTKDPIMVADLAEIRLTVRGGYWKNTAPSQLIAK